MTLKEIANFIQARTKAENKRFVANPSFAGGCVIMDGKKRYVWITNHESKRDSIDVKDITGAVVDTADSHTIHTLQEYGKDMVTICKNMPIARLILNNFGYAQLPNGRPFEIPASYAWGAYFSESTPIKVGTIELNEWRRMLIKKMLQYGESTISESERKRLEQELKELEETPVRAAEFIREQVSLRNNPILDKEQEEAKFSHIYDGVVEIIDGGPGTGKTTTLIQRLKYLITPKEINATHEVEGQNPLTKAQSDLLEDDDRNWLFFSPTKQLCNYLRSNMEYEGLTKITSHTQVWIEHLRNILANEYNLAGKDNPFDFKLKKYGSLKIFKRKTLAVAKAFEGYYLTNILKRIRKVAIIDCTQFDWNDMGSRIVNICKEADKVHSLSELVKILIRLESLKTLSSIPGKKSIPEIEAQFKETLDNIALNVFSQIKHKPDLYEELLEMVAKWGNNEEDDDSSEASDDNEKVTAAQRPEVKLNRAIRQLITLKSLLKYDAKLAVKGRSQELSDKIAGLLNEQAIAKLSQFAYFHRYLNPVVANLETILLGSITKSYKLFRAQAYKQRQERDWYIKTLEIIIDNNQNRLLLSQEQALVLGFINNVIRTIRKVSGLRYSKMTHRFYKAYLNCCRPIIGVDEATDYSLYDYYAIASLRHPVLSSVTLCGDLMQGLTEYGINDWKQLKSPLIFTKIDKKELLISYRQSPKLLTLAQFLYLSDKGTESPYSSKLSDSKFVPVPLWYSSDDLQEKADWMVERILEVKKAYVKLPSIAVFVADKKDIEPLKEAMEESEELDAAAIVVKNCGDDDIDARPDTVRIFPIDKVKGMEFEVVFFHDIHNLPNMKLAARYLYIGLSRASFYMAVTSKDEIDDSLESIKELFTIGEDWKPINFR